MDSHFKNKQKKLAIETSSAIVSIVLITHCKYNKKNKVLWLLSCFQETCRGRLRFLDKIIYTRLAQRSTSLHVERGIPSSSLLDQIYGYIYIYIYISFDRYINIHVWCSRKPVPGRVSYLIFLGSGFVNFSTVLIWPIRSLDVIGQYWKILIWPSACSWILEALKPECMYTRH